MVDTSLKSFYIKQRYNITKSADFEAALLTKIREAIIPKNAPKK